MCRKAGLEKKRRCAWLTVAEPERVVWARADVALTQCPRSVVTADSIGMVEEFFVWRRMGTSMGDLTARQVEAFVVLENAMEQERRNGERRTRDAV